MLGPYKPKNQVKNASRSRFLKLGAECINTTPANNGVLRSVINFEML